MVGEDIIPKMQQMAQAALEVPTNVLNTETRHLTEKLGVLNMEVQKAAGVITPPQMPMQLPQLPPLPGLGAMGAGETMAARSEVIRGVQARKTTSYLEK